MGVEIAHGNWLLSTWTPVIVHHGGGGDDGGGGGDGGDHPLYGGHCDDDDGGRCCAGDPGRYGACRRRGIILSTLSGLKYLCNFADTRYSKT